jgi:hypothetical protein
MDEQKPKRYWRKKRWQAFAFFWLIAAGPLATGPFTYGVRRGWVPHRAGDAAVLWVNRYMGLVGLRPYAEEYQRWWGMQAAFAEFDHRVEEGRRREAWQPPPPPVMRRLRQGGFAHVALHDGTVVEGYAASDPDDAEFVRIDGLGIHHRTGNLDRFALRLAPKEIKTAEPLDAAPRLRLRDGTTLVMPAEFWSDPGT